MITPKATIPLSEIPTMLLDTLTRTKAGDRKPNKKLYESSLLLFKQLLSVIDESSIHFSRGELRTLRYYFYKLKNGRNKISPLHDYLIHLLDKRLSPISTNQ